ncbi:MAG: hypothetical protein WC480_00600 [Patescibacteria group bacterium]
MTTFSSLVDSLVGSVVGTKSFGMAVADLLAYLAKMQPLQDPKQQRLLQAAEASFRDAPAMKPWLACVATWQILEDIFTELADTQSAFEDSHPGSEEETRVDQVTSDLSDVLNDLHDLKGIDDLQDDQLMAEEVRRLTHKCFLAINAWLEIMGWLPQEG